MSDTYNIYVYLNIILISNVMTDLLNWDSLKIQCTIYQNFEV
jgi:hypothetical protein